MYKRQDYLQSSLGIPVRLEEEDNLGNEYVLIEKTGSGGEDHIKRATLAIQSYSCLLYTSCNLDGEKIMKAIQEQVGYNDG